MNIDNFNYLLDNLLINLYDYENITPKDKDNIKTLIYNRLKLRSDLIINDYEYLKKLKKSLDNFYPLLGGAIQDILINDLQNTPKETKGEKYINGGQLAIILGITKGNITNLRKQGKYFTNTIQTEKGTSLKIPFSDIEVYIKQNKKYLNKWLEYIKNI